MDPKMRKHSLQIDRTERNRSVYPAQLLSLVCGGLVVDVDGSNCGISG